MNNNYNLNDLESIAKAVIANAEHKIVLFNGNMGAGKTTLIKELCKVLGVEDVAHSPTFSLVNEYLTQKGETVYHFDFYRIDNEEEAYDMGIEDYLYSGNWCFIEWAENIENLLPLKTVVIDITLSENNTRNIKLTNN